LNLSVSFIEPGYLQVHSSSFIAYIDPKVIILKLPL
jgi:hypothetical protein